MTSSSFRCCHIRCPAENEAKRNGAPTATSAFYVVCDVADEFRSTTLATNVSSTPPTPCTGSTADAIDDELNEQDGYCVVYLFNYHVPLASPKRDYIPNVPLKQIFKRLLRGRTPN